MGVVLPHGGFVADVWKSLASLWTAKSVRLSNEVTLLEADFAKPGAALGEFRRDAEVMSFVLMHEEWGLDWCIRVDDKRPTGAPAYFMTRETVNALMRAIFLGDSLLEIDGKRYRLHAATLEGVHVALLIGVER
jgi:hypothetical protein